MDNHSCRAATWNYENNCFGSTDRRNLPHCSPSMVSFEGAHAGGDHTENRPEPSQGDVIVVVHDSIPTILSSQMQSALKPYQQPFLGF